jgi:hypothetical protein
MKLGILIAGLFFSITCFASYDIEILNSQAKIKKDGKVIKTVSIVEKNKEIIKEIQKMVESIKEHKKNSEDTIQMLLASDMKEMAEEYRQESLHTVEILEKGLEALMNAHVLK